ncbi:MAG: NUMOD3 domain-containing DNA-binding protein [Candidatus Beckwithbacteria bacterium]
MPYGIYNHRETKTPIYTTERNSKIGISRIGKKLSEETKKKMALAHKGEKSHLWKGGITSENKRIRDSIEYRLWREAVFARDNWICQKTKVRGSELHPHHILNFAEYPELRFAIDNGITLSEKSHREFHKIYGEKNNNKEQIGEFIK